MEINIGLSDSVRQQIAQNLNMLLADTYVLYVKTQNFYWNLTGSHFHSLGLLLKQEEESLRQAINDVAERIHCLGMRSSIHLKNFLEITSLKESDNDLPADEMLMKLLNDHETICRFLRDRAALTVELKDQVSTNLLIQHLHIHEKSASILRDLLSSY